MKQPVRSALVCFLIALPACEARRQSLALPEPVKACRRACERCPGAVCMECSTAVDRFREPVRRAMLDCVARADACGSLTWTTCLNVAIATTSPSFHDDDFRLACFAKKGACEGTKPEFPANDCIASRALTEPWLERAGACLPKNCAETKTCLDAIFP